MPISVKERIRKLIRENIYPKDKFPRSIFPDLDPILTELCLREERDRFSGNNADNITDSVIFENIVSKTINLKTILSNFPNTLILIYKNLINLYVFKRHLNKEEVEEIVQEIISRLLKDKINGIRRRFDFNNHDLPTFTSYFMVTVRNIYIDIIRKESKGKYIAENERDIETFMDRGSGDMLNSLILEEEFRKFNALMKLYHSTGKKLKLALKIKYNIPIDESDILSYFPYCTDEEKELFKGRGKFLRGRKSMERIVPVFNKYEEKSNNPDTLRKWTSTKLDEFKRHMNNTHPHSPYNNSTISDLIILYFKWEKGMGD